MMWRKDEDKKRQEAVKTGAIFKKKNYKLWQK